MSGNIRVVCRFRPQNSKEIARGGQVVVNFLNEQTLHLNVVIFYFIFYFILLNIHLCQ